VYQSEPIRFRRTGVFLIFVADPMTNKVICYTAQGQ
jgi:hypothetical protein